jgi:hypothetical protein
MRPRLVGIIALGGLLLTGCQTARRPLYYWGHYEGMIYASYSAPQKAPPERQIDLMLEDAEKAASLNLPLPPGFRAHLGYLYFQTGRYDRAQMEFEAEKQHFPEATVFMDRMLQQFSKPAPAKS